jgi:hypothetical protein
MIPPQEKLSALSRQRSASGFLLSSINLNCRLVSKPLLLLAES